MAVPTHSHPTRSHPTRSHPTRSHLTRSHLTPGSLTPDRWTGHWDGMATGMGEHFALPERPVPLTHGRPHASEEVRPAGTATPAGGSSGGVDPDVAQGTAARID
jgi:hypothetical protein